MSERKPHQNVEVGEKKSEAQDRDIFRCIIAPFDRVANSFSEFAEILSIFYEDCSVIDGELIPSPASRRRERMNIVPLIIYDGASMHKVSIAPELTDSSVKMSRYASLLFWSRRCLGAYP